MKKIRVSLYIRKDGKYEKAEKKIYPHGTIFRFAIREDVGDVEGLHRLP